MYSAYNKPVYKFESRNDQLKSSISHRVVYDLSNIILVCYAFTVTLIFSDKQLAIYTLGYYLSVTFIQDGLFSLKTYN